MLLLQGIASSAQLNSGADFGRDNRLVAPADKHETVAVTYFCSILELRAEQVSSLLAATLGNLLCACIIQASCLWLYIISTCKPYLHRHTRHIHPSTRGQLQYSSVTTIAY